MRQGEVAGDRVGAVAVLEFRLFGSAALGGVAAAGVERATRRAVRGIGNVAFHDDPAAGLARVGLGDGGEQRLRIGAASALDACLTYE